MAMVVAVPHAAHRSSPTNERQQGEARKRPPLSNRGRMKVHRGGAQFVCTQGARYVNVGISFTDERWHYEVLRAGPTVELSGFARGAEATWAVAYRRAMRAAERMLGRKHD